ncbi:hypothetical protein F0M18_03325 [Pseudohalioglobus sediminis]|uniref:Tetratricopeptide repeat protein n=1 Tax=Pseudohalioglobus sediminis TaxID=2606449 RepID=A0A5B0X550_9GAMM|nr:hypothetical protein [Pseudohalioglobus sediminis]KAA1194474.1 hypothetical protein F0M18_03325 [Pseudohalioglobus sediminis]
MRAQAVWPGLAQGLLLVAVLGLVYWIYAPGAAGPLLLDDRSSLGKLENLGGSSAQALDYVLGNNSGPLGRPVSMASFVLEKLYGDGSVATAKTVNIALHLITGAVVAWLFTLLLQAVRAPLAGAAGVLFAAVWMLAPMHVSTVLYVVQRMAMLATLFSLLALVGYLYWRRSVSAGRPQHWRLLPVVAAIALAVFSKENGILVIPLILLTEVIWLQCCDDNGSVLKGLRKWAGLAITAGLVATLLLLLVYWGALDARHHFREFNLAERLFTQSRVLWDYVSQFYLPDPRHLGIYHDDFAVSQSLLQPGATLYAVLGWALVLALLPLLWRWPWWRRVMLGPVFFLAAHAMESTVWPLELYFEHRNYLPSVGLVLLPLSGFALLASRWPQVARPLLAWCGVAIVVLTVQTSPLVTIWSSGPLLTMHHVNGHPESARANRDYATLLARAGAADAALRYSEAAYHSAQKYAAANDEHHGDFVLRNIALACMARAPLAPAEYTELGSQNPDRPLGQVFTMSTVIKLRQQDACPGFDWDGFMEHLAGLYLQRFDTRLASTHMFAALAMLANAHGHWEYAHAYTQRYLERAPGSVRAMLMQLHFATALGRSEEAQGYIDRLQELQRAGKLSTDQQSTLSLYLEN